MKNKILVVEDDFLLVRLYKRAFELEGYEVETAYGGEEALEKLKSLEKKPDLILLDIVMPRINGLDLLREIKKDPAIKNIPVVVFTNISEKKEEDEAMSLGASMYLLKGELDIKDVLQKICPLIK